MITSYSPAFLCGSWIEINWEGAEEVAHWKINMFHGLKLWFPEVKEG
jgi:hypothetical protein